MKKVLIIEDDIGIANSLKLYLENSGFEVEVYTTGKNALKKIEKYCPTLIILDINLPEKNGIEICKELRKKSSIPVVMLTARNSELDKIAGLEIGADDYISKPFSPRELLARVNTILRRTGDDIIKNEEKNIVTFDDVKIDLDKFVITKNNENISFTKNEFDILKKLVEEDGKMVDRETLMTEIIGYEHYMFDRTIDTHIKNIRKKLGDKDIIITIRGKGYRLNK